MLDRAAVRTETRALSPVERRTLRGLGVKLGAFSVYIPSLLRPEALPLRLAFQPDGWSPTLLKTGSWDAASDLPLES